MSVRWPAKGNVLTVGIRSDRLRPRPEFSLIPTLVLVRLSQNPQIFGFLRYVEEYSLMMLYQRLRCLCKNLKESEVYENCCWQRREK